MGVSLGLVGIVDKGIYNPDETYNKGNFILHEGSTWLALKDKLQGVEPAEGESWKFLARGFAAEILSLITAVDSAGLVGNAGAETDGQTLLDAIADKVANQLLEKKMMSNVQVNDPTMVPTSALAYAMQQAITQLNSELNTRSTTILFEGELKVGDTFTLNASIMDYRFSRIINMQNNMAYAEHIIASDATTLMCGILIDVASSDVFVLMDFAATTTDGINYTVVRNTQVNINAKGVQYLNREISSTWRICGVK